MRYGTMFLCMERREGEQNREGKVWYALAFALQLGFLIVVPIGGFLLLGAWIDRHLHTSPLFLLGGAVGGVFLTAREVRDLLVILLQDAQRK